MIDIGKLFIQDGFAQPADNHDIAKDILRSMSIVPEFNPMTKSLLTQEEIYKAQKPYLGEDKFDQNPVISPPHVQRQVMPKAPKEAAKTPKQDPPTKESAKKPMKSPKEVIKEAQEHIKLSESATVKAFPEKKVENDSGIASKSHSYNSSGNQSVLAARSPTTKPRLSGTQDVKQDAQNVAQPIDHSTPKPTPEYVPRRKRNAKELDSSNGESPAPKRDSKRPSPVKSETSELKIEQRESTELKTGKESSELKVEPKSESPEPSKEGSGGISSVGCSSTSSLSDNFKNTICDEEFERELDKSLSDLKKPQAGKQAPEVSSYQK